MNLTMLPAATLGDIGQTFLRTHRPALERYPLTNFVLPQVEAALAALLEALPASLGAHASQVLAAQIVEADRRHDTAFRRLYFALHAALQEALLDQDDESAQLLREILAIVAPEGLSQVIKAYDSEASEARMNLDSMGPRHEAVMKRRSLNGVDFMGLGQGYLAAAEHLGGLLFKQRTAEGAEASQATLQDHRLELVRQFGRLFRMVDESDLPAELVNSLRAPFIEAIDGHLRRSSARKASSQGGSEVSEQGTTQQGIPDAESVDAAAPESATAVGAVSGEAG